MVSKLQKGFFFRVPMSKFVHFVAENGVQRGKWELLLVIYEFKCYGNELEIRTREIISLFYVNPYISHYQKQNFKSIMSSWGALPTSESEAISNVNGKIWSTRPSMNDFDSKSKGYEVGIGYKYSDFFWFLILFIRMMWLFGYEILEWTSMDSGTSE